MNYTVTEERCKNSIGMSITIWKVMGDDGITYAETRFSDVACAVANMLTQRDETNCAKLT